MEFDEDFYLVAELTQESNAVVGHAAKLSQQNNGTIAQTTNLNPNIRYKIVVYNNSGLYMTEKDYIRGQETSASPLMLDGGLNYTFIVYSVNSTTVLPSVTFVNPANKTLTTSSVNVTGVQDFMYFRKDMTVSGDNTNYLGVILKHRFSQITTTVDATATGYNITALTSAINPQHLPNANITLDNGTINRSGTATTVAVTFPTFGSQTIIGTPNIINANANSTTSYTIDNITIGPLTQSNITPFTNLNITPGVKYNMKLTIIPQDIYLTHLGQPAARVNGKIWMLHNLGVSTSLDANQNPYNSALVGNYYQWGRNAVVANATTQSGAISPWITATTQAANSWNIGTEANPTKTGSDPCPSGYRIPTETELNALINATVQTNVGTQNNSPTNYTAAKVFTSKRNASVKVVFPIAGNRRFDTGAVENRGNTGFYWSSTTISNRYYHYSLSFSAVTIGNSVAAWAFPIRCVQQ
ncbi:hypothetical protein OKW96_06040 [Sphingobacterium sp. KU25419]|nr:hypothetical protein OKW96_06040 [Sphingobacterium sp. KU25419]